MFTRFFGSIEGCAKGKKQDAEDLKEIRESMDAVFANTMALTHRLHATIKDPEHPLAPLGLSAAEDVLKLVETSNEIHQHIAAMEDTARDDGTFLTHWRCWNDEQRRKFWTNQIVRESE
jgi:hypothetical protein